MAPRKRFSSFDLVRFFVESFIDGIKNNLRLFIGACGFICAVGAVFAGTHTFSPFLKSEKNLVADEAVNLPEPNHDDLPIRSIASIPGHAMIQSSRPDFASSNSNSQAGDGLGLSNPTQNYQVNPIASTEGTSLPIRNERLRYGDVGANAYSKNAEKTSGSSLNSVDLVSESPGGNRALPLTQANTLTNGGVSTPSESSRSNFANLSAASGSFISAGAGAAAGAGVSVRASVGEVISSNYSPNTQFLLISGVAQILY